MDFTSILIGLGSGVGSALIGYIKKLPKDSPNKINLWKAAPSIILGGAAGVYAGYYNISLASAEAIFFTATAVTFVNQGVSFVKGYLESRKLINSGFKAPIKNKKKGKK